MSDKDKIEKLPFPPFLTRIHRDIEDIRKACPQAMEIEEEPEVLIGARLPNGHVHLHYPEETATQKIVKNILEEKPELAPKAETKYIEVKDDKEQVVSGTRKIVFAHRRALGDGLMFTAGVRDFKLLFPHIQVGVDSNQGMLWENNPHIVDLDKNADDVEYYKVGYPMGDVNRSYRHFTGMFLMDMIASADEHSPLTNPDGTRFNLWQFAAAFGGGHVGDPSMSDPDKNTEAREPFISLRKEYRELGGRGFAHQCGDLYLTDKERRTNIIADSYGAEKYWVIAPGGKRDCTAKIWDWRKFQAVIDHFDGLIKFVVIGRSDHLIQKLDNVIDLTDKFNKDVRGLVPLVYHAEGCVAGPSFLTHFAAAMPGKQPKDRKACVSIWGAREPAGWCFYTNHQMLHTNNVFSCATDGGCWKARTIPLQKDPKHNKNLCRQTVKVDDVTVQACMNSITSEDVIRAIERYYDGDLRSLSSEKKVQQVQVRKRTVPAEAKKRAINLLGNLNTDGGGEQSFLKIGDVLSDAGWDVEIYPWGDVSERFKGHILNHSYEFADEVKRMSMREGVPTLFYANDCVWDFANNAQSLIEKMSDLIIGINFMNGPLPKTPWMADKLRGVVFQSTEKKNEWIRDFLGNTHPSYYVIPGAIDLSAMLEVCPPERTGDLVILKHGKPDKRKYVVEETKNKGDKVHIWQQNFAKDLDTKFYSRLLKDTKGTRFEFMSAPDELRDHFKGESRMVFHEWNSMSVPEFLGRGHLYMDHLSNDWRHQYPRTIGEALAAGLPVLCEPRDGALDRVQYGDTGFYCVDYDEYKESIRKLQRKEGARQKMGRYAKDWARQNLRPENWVEVITEILNG